MTDSPPHREISKPDVRPWLKIGAGEIVIDIVAQPRSSRRDVVRAGPQGLVIAINSPPDKGKANEELIAYLAKELRVPRAAVMIIRGAASRKKSIRIITHEPARIASRLRRIGSPD